MKKNKTMRAASFLLVLTLATSCFVGGTFAKYTTTDSASDKAQVAKWGVTVTATDTAMFQESVAKDGNNIVASATTGTNVVAPGTSGNLAATTITGTPEVAVAVKYEATVKLENWTINENEFYCPIVFTVGDTTIKQDDTNKDATTFIASVETAIEGYSKEYVAGVNLANEAKPAISWEWEFEKTKETVQTNEKDTALGNVAANGTAPSIEVSVTTTVEQIASFTGTPSTGTVTP